MATTPMFPDGAKRKTPTPREPRPRNTSDFYFSPWNTSDFYFSPFEDAKSKLSKKSVEESIELNKETLKALQTVGKSIDTVLFGKDKKFDTYLADMYKVVEQQKEIQLQIDAERQQNEKKTKEELRILLSHISELSGVEEKDVATSLADKQSEMFKALPKDLANNLSVLLKNDKNALSTIVKENEDVKKKEKEILDEEEKKKKKFYDNIIEKTNDVFDKNSDVLKQSLLGPVNLLLGPMEDFFGFDFYNSAKSFLFGSEGGRGEEKKPGLVQKIFKKKPAVPGEEKKPSGLKGLFKKKDKKKELFKKRPTVADVANIGDMGSLLIYNALSEGKNKDRSNGNDESMLDDMLGEAGGNLMGKMITSFLPKLLPLLTAALPIAIPLLLGAGIVGLFANAIANPEKYGLDDASVDASKKDPTRQAIVTSRGGIISDEDKAAAVASQAADPKMVALTERYNKILADADAGDADAIFLRQHLLSLNKDLPALAIEMVEKYTSSSRDPKKVRARRLIPSKYHSGGIIGSDGLANPNNIIAQKGEVILPISESRYGLQSGVLQSTSSGGMGINRNLIQYDAPAISLPPTGMQRQETTFNEYNNQSKESKIVFDTNNIESKLDSVVTLLQSLLSKEPVQMSQQKQSNSDLELLIYGGAF